jgi:hypothetical protein
LTENSNVSEPSKNRNPSRDVPVERRNHGQNESEAEEHLHCKLQAKLDENGKVVVVSMDEGCFEVIEKLPPVKREFWKRRLAPELRGKTKQAEESEEVEESKNGRQTT